MSKLPQRKKTPEEIAKLRETMGLGGPPSTAPPSSDPLADETATAGTDTTAPASSISAPLPPHSGTIPDPRDSAVVSTPSSLPKAPISSPVESLPAIPAADAHSPAAPKQVRSLRKSERGPAPASAVRPSPSSEATSLPSQRRSGFEINQLRRSQAFTVQPPINHVIAQMAPLLIVVLGYATAFLAAILPLIDRFAVKISVVIPALLCVASMAIAVFIFLKKKRSLHHAAFIGVIGFFTLLFGSFYYFPNLWNAS